MRQDPHQSLYPAVYTDARGSVETVVVNDGVTMGVRIRGVDFAGNDLDCFEPSPDATTEKLRPFTLHAGSLCSCRIECDIPVAVSGRIETNGVLRVDLVLGDPAPNGAPDGQTLRLRRTGEAANHADVAAAVVDRLVRRPVGREVIAYRALRPFAFFTLAVVALLTAGCGGSESHSGVAPTDPQVSEFADMLSVDRAALGLPALPSQLSFWVERADGRAYDVMLHFDDKPLRTIAFRRVGGKLKWVHEQVIVEGPRRHTTPDGTFPESLTFTYETAPVSGATLNRLNVSYDGPDMDLYMKSDLGAKDVQPMLDRWQAPAKAR